MTAVHFRTALGDGAAPIGVLELSRPARIVDVGTTCSRVQEAFRADPDLTCLAVLAAAGDGQQHLGLVSRGAFLSAMVGPFGYGQALYSRRSVAQLADWNPVILSEATSVADAAERILAREVPPDKGEVLVCSPSGASSPVSFVTVTDVFRALTAALTARVLTDQLTGLGNRAYFLQRLSAAGNGSDGTTGRLAVAYIDVDEFKTINDRFGHSLGDQALQLVAHRLRGCAGPRDVVARLGGDEFAVMVADPDPEWHAPAFADRLLDRLSAPIDLGGRVLPGRVSIGLAVASTLPVDPSMLLHEADLAMYRAKAAGGVRSEVVENVRDRGELTFAPDRRDLEQAARDGEFVLHYQPIVEVTTGQLQASEALVRWAHPLHGMLSPAQFLGAVAAAGFAADLDRWVLRAALTQQAAWFSRHRDDAPPHVNVNLSVPGLLNPDLADLVADELARAKLPARMLRLELPEVATSTQVHVAQPALHLLRTAGVGLTLDDMGTGAAGLSHLSDLHLDGVKIDRRFVANMLDDERDAAVVRMLVEMAHGLGITVTAEGAETEDHLSALRTLARGRPIYVQGYAIARPLPADQITLPWPVPEMHARRLVFRQR